MSLDDIINAIVSGLKEFRFQDLLDILIITVIVYKIIEWSVNTKAFQLLKGLAVLLIVMLLSTIFDLYTTSYLLNTLLVSGICVLWVIFQPELRRGLAHIGRIKFNFMFKDKAVDSGVVKEIVNALIELSKRKVGALIVIERETRLDEYLPTGTPVDAQVTSALIQNIFEPNTTLHDGAVIMREGRIHYAACVLPLFEDPNISRELGTRHRAALGISQVSDSLTLVVSEETGVISYAENGSLVRYVETVFSPSDYSKPLAFLTKRFTKDEKKNQ